MKELKEERNRLSSMNELYEAKMARSNNDHEYQMLRLEE